MAEGTINIEQQIAELEQALVEKRAALQEQHAAGEIEQIPHDKEILHQAIQERMAEVAVPQNSATPVPVQQQTDDTIQAPLPPPVVDLPSYLSPELHEPVQNLINIAFTQNLDVAIGQARATNNAALIDAFHDVLVDELYKYLVERGKIKEVK